MWDVRLASGIQPGQGNGSEGVFPGRLLRACRDSRAAAADNSGRAGSWRGSEMGVFWGEIPREMKVSSGAGGWGEEKG